MIYRNRNGDHGSFHSPERTMSQQHPPDVMTGWCRVEPWRVQLDQIISLAWGHLPRRLQISSKRYPRSLNYAPSNFLFNAILLNIRRIFCYWHPASLWDAAAQQEYVHHREGNIVGRRYCPPYLQGQCVHYLVPAKPIFSLIRAISLAGLSIEERNSIRMNEK